MTVKWEMPGAATTAVGTDAPTALERRLEVPVGLGEIPHQLRQYVDVRPLLKPIDVVEEQRDRDRVGLQRVDPTLIEVRHKGVHAGGVEVPVGAGA
jgi:hypothetical protein